MPSTNGHGPRRAVFYARVSTDEQPRSGYSLAHEGGFDLGRFPPLPPGSSGLGTSRATYR
jgi:hypothetical protein